jgi:hypothetical protein
MIENSLDFTDIDRLGDSPSDMQWARKVYAAAAEK